MSTIIFSWKCSLTPILSFHDQNERSACELASRQIDMTTTTTTHHCNYFASIGDKSYYCLWLFLPWLWTKGAEHEFKLKKRIWCGQPPAPSVSSFLNHSCNKAQVFMPESSHYSLWSVCTRRTRSLLLLLLWINNQNFDDLLSYWAKAASLWPPKITSSERNKRNVFGNRRQWA